MPRWRASSGVFGATSTPSTRHGSRGQRDDAGHDFGQRRFAGAVLADQRMDLAAAQVEIDVFDRGNAGVELGRLAQGEDDVAHAPNSLLERGERQPQDAARALGDDDEIAVELDRRHDAVVDSVDAAVQRVERRTVGVEADDEAVGARRRPGLDDAHGLDVRALHRLLERLAGTQARRDPVSRLDLRHHAPPVGRLAQHELDELGARGEGGQPEAAGGGRRKARRIDRQMGQHDRRRCRRGDREHAMPPAFADERRIACGAGAERVARGRRRASSPFRSLGSSSEDPPGAAALHQVVSPIASTPRVVEPSVAISAAVRRRRERVDGLQPARRTAACGFAADGVADRRAPRARPARPRGRRPAGRRARRSAGRRRRISVAASPSSRRSLRPVGE